MSENNDFQIKHEHLKLLEDELQQGKLYKVFMICPLLEKYFTVDDPVSIQFEHDFLDYFNVAMIDRELLFIEDEPRKHHKFAASDQVMFNLLVPPDLVLSINGNLLLKRNEIILESILGVYLFNETDQFFTNKDFSADKVKQWVVQRNSQPTETTRKSLS